MPPRVTIAIPVHRRIEFLPFALRSVDAQIDADIELIVSDHLADGQRLVEMIELNYNRPYILRSCPPEQTIVQHWNSLIEAATGEYFSLLCYDDEITPTYVSELSGLLASQPQAAVAIARLEMMDPQGQVITQHSVARPLVMASESFVRAWSNSEYDFSSSTVTVMARTADIRRCGGYPEFPQAVHSDDALLIKLCALGDVALGQTCAFRWRVDENSAGFSTPYPQAAEAIRRYLAFLANDPTLQAFARRYPDAWHAMYANLVRRSGRFYLWLWKDIYSHHLSRMEWLRAVFALPQWYRYWRSFAIGFVKVELKRMFPTLLHL